MQQLSLFVYLTFLGAATLVIAFAVLQSRIRKEPGQRIFYRDLALVFLIAFYLPGIIFYFDRDLSLWWLVIPAVSLGLAFKGLLAAFVWKSVPLTRVDLPSVDKLRANGLRIAHLSDLHLTAAPSTLEGGLQREDVIDANRRALKWACEQEPDLIAITGDVTDTGEAAEWEIFESLLDELPKELRGKVAFVPGNHDLSIQQRHFGASNDGNALLDYDKRCAALVRAYFAHMPPNATVQLMQKNAFDAMDLETLYGMVDKQIESYRRFPPRAENASEMMRGMTKNFKDTLKGHAEMVGGRRALTEYVPGIVIADEYRATFNPDSGFWPNGKYPLMQDLLFAMYPLLVHEDERAIVIALNSNTVPSTWLADGALGRLGNAQLILLDAALKDKPKSKAVVVLVHHHIGCPHDVQRLIAHSMVELKALQLHEGPLLVEVLKRHGAPAVVLHGHKHIGYLAKAADGVAVLSAASVPYGDRRGGDNCNAVVIDSSGQVAVYASATIRCATSDRAKAA